MSLNAPSGGNVSSPHHSRLHWSSHSHSLAPRNVQKVEWLPVCVTQRRVKKQNGVKCTKTWDWICFSRWITPCTAFFLGDFKKKQSTKLRFCQRWAHRWAAHLPAVTSKTGCPGLTLKGGVKKEEEEEEEAASDTWPSHK